MGEKGFYQEKITDDLCQELMEESDISSYMKEKDFFFSNKSVSELLSELYADKDISKAELARRSNMSEVYLHQLFSGRRKPSRDKMLCLCVGMQLTIEESQRLLKCASFAPLYPRIRREAIIYHGIVHKRSLEKINETMLQEQEEILG